MIFNEALAPAQIKRLYNNGNGTEMLGEVDDRKIRRNNNLSISTRSRYE
jgi:hypothetical protein